MRPSPTIAAIVAAALVGCEPKTNSVGETIVLEWTDAAAECHYELTMRQNPIFGYRSMLYVRSATMQQSVQIDDDASFGTAALIEDGDWVLVASDDEVWAGFDRRAGLLVGENELDRLPYTIGASSRPTLVSRRVGDRTSPADFIRRPASRPSS